LDHQTFQDELDKALSEIILAEIQQQVDNRFEAYRQTVRYISALDRKYQGESLIREGLPSVFNNLRDQLNNDQSITFHRRYQEAVQRLDCFPKEVNWPQEEPRFVSQDDDALLVRTGKTAKRAGRSVSKAWHIVSHIGKASPSNGQWSRQVPLDSVVKHQLLDLEAIRPLIDALERVRLEFITDLEEWLVQRCRGEESQSLTDFARKLDEQLQEQKSVIEKQASDIFDQKKRDLVERVQKVGTFEDPSRRYNHERLARRSERFESNLETHFDKWVSVEQLLLDRTRDVGQFLNLQTEIDSKVQDFKTDFEALFRDKLHQPLAELAQILDTSMDEVGRENVMDEVKKLKGELAEFVNHRLIAPVQTLLEKQVMSGKVEHFFESLLLSSGQAQSEAQLLFDLELGEDPPKLNEKQIDWRQLVVRMLREQLINPLQPSEQAYEPFLSEMLTDIREIENIIEVNLESALAAEDEHADQEVEHPQKIAREALERIRGKVTTLQERTDQKWEVIQNNIQQGQQKLTSSLLALLHEGNAKQLQLLNAKYKVKETTKDWRTVVDSRWARFQDQLSLWWRFAAKKSKAYTQAVRAFAGMDKQQVTETKRADIATYLSETDDKMKKLPYIYRRLFNFDAVADERFFVPSPEAIGTFKKALSQWQESFPTNFAIVGEKGSGKSTFLNRMAENQIEDQELKRVELTTSISSELQLVELLAEQLDIPGVETAEQLVEAICGQEQRYLVIMEGMQNAFVRTINGYEAIEKLCYVISETKEQLFWAVSCSRYAWRFLDKAVQCSEYFSHIATADTLDADQMKSVIMNRHRSSGYSLVFEADADTRQSRGYRKLQDQQEEAQQYLMDQYFAELTQLAEGNASVAMIFWIRSIREFDDTAFYIQPLEVTSVEMIEDLNPQVLFTLAAFVLHDTLADEDLSRIMGISQTESRLLINRLQSRGLLVSTNETYTINHLMYRQILRVLKDRNIIHLT